MLKLKTLSVLLLLFISISGVEKTKQSKKINLEELTIAKIRQAYKDGTCNSQELVAAYIEAIKEKNKAINAISIINPGALSLPKPRTKIIRKPKNYDRCREFPLL